MALRYRTVVGYVLGTDAAGFSHCYDIIANHVVHLVALVLSAS